jgi:hypothetical protein
VQFGTGGNRMGFLRLIWDFQAGWQRFWRSTCANEVGAGSKVELAQGCAGGQIKLELKFLESDYCIVSSMLLW